MGRTLQAALCLLALTVSLAVGAVGFAVYWTVTDLGETEARLNAALDTINRPCAPGPCGTLANIDKAVVKLGDIAVTSQRQEQETARAAQQTMDTVAGVAAHVNTLSDSLAGTATAATGTLTAAADALSEGQRTLAALQPVLGHSDAAVADLDALLKDQAIHRTFDHVESITASGDKILADAAFEADKFTHPQKKKLTFWSGVYTAVEWIHKVEPPLF
jgi:hypothetical protein